MAENLRTGCHKRDINHSIAGDSMERISQDIKRCRYEPEKLKTTKLSCGQKKCSKRPHVIYSCPSSEPQLGQNKNSLDSGRKRTLPISDRGSTQEFASDNKTNSDSSYKCIVVSQSDSQESKDSIMQNLLCKRSKPTLAKATEVDASSTTITLCQSTLSDHGAAVTDESLASSNQLSHEFVKAKVIADVDVVIGMLQCKMKGIYDGDLSARATHVSECISDMLVSPAEHICQDDADIGPPIAKLAPASSNLGVDPILALSLRLRSILLQSPSIS